MNVWIPVVLLAIGLLGFLGKAKLAKPVADKFGSILGLKAEYVFLGIGIVGIVLGAGTTVAGFVSDWGKAANISGDDVDTQSDVTGLVTVKVHDGLSNATTTEDVVDDTETEMTINSADASIADGEEYAFNVTIERELIAEDANIKVTCSIEDKELDGVLASNLAEKTSGRIDLDINDGGNYLDDNTVYKNIAFAEGTGTHEVQIAFDQEETYHDGMQDQDDYVDVNCDADGVNFRLRVYADS